MSYTQYAKPNNLPSVKKADEVRRSSLYVNQQIHQANKPSNYMNVPDSNTNSYATIQYTE